MSKHMQKLIEEETNIWKRQLEQNTEIDKQKRQLEQTIGIEQTIWQNNQNK